MVKYGVRAEPPADRSWGMRDFVSHRLRLDQSYLSAWAESEPVAVHHAQRPSCSTPRGQFSGRHKAFSRTGLGRHDTCTNRR